MDYFGRALIVTCTSITSKVSILLGQWITLEVDKHLCWLNAPLKFQSFWVNGLLWKKCWECRSMTWWAVSILLGQWITLEEAVAHWCAGTTSGFNPSGSMDYFGSAPFNNEIGRALEFQSFWVNGLLWKDCEINVTSNYISEFQSFWVNGLLWKPSGRLTRWFIDVWI